MPWHSISASLEFWLTPKTPLRGNSGNTLRNATLRRLAIDPEVEGLPSVPAMFFARPKMLCSSRLFSTSPRAQALRRALLYIPGSSEKMLSKSRTLKVDGLTFDLEDAVSVEQKPAARRQVANHLKTLVKGTQERIVRINSRHSGFAEADLAALEGVDYDTIMLPKTQSADDVCWLASKLRPGVKIISLIESGLAVMNIKEIATAHKQLSGLVFAAEDFAASMNITRSASLAEMGFARQAVVTAARAYGLDSIDLVCTSYKDLDALEKECHMGASFGYSGKQAIHPNQVDTIQSAFSPNAERVAWAKELLKKASDEKRGAFEFQGKMIDAPVLLAAKNLLDLHKAGLEPVRGLLLGAPGAGKGTQSKRIVAKYPNISILSSGDLLRDHMNRGTELGLSARDTIARGELIDDATMCDLVISTIKERGYTSRSFFLDGFPRTVAQAGSLDAFLQDLGSPMNFVINLDVPYGVILERVENRWIHAPSGRTYNLTYNPPKVQGKDDVTGEALSKRVDDDVDTFKARLGVYDGVTTPLKSYYAERGVLKTFAGETSDVIWPQIDAELESRQ